MDNFHKYKPTDKMSNVISENYSLISVMSRPAFRIWREDRSRGVQ